MGNVKIDEKLYKRFQYYVLRRMGQKKGNVKVCAEEAINLWIDTLRAEAKSKNGKEMDDYASVEEYLEKDWIPKATEWNKQIMGELRRVK